jgi:hypothetical protein
MTSGAFQQAPGGTYVTELNAAGSGLVYSALFGQLAFPTAIGVGSSDNAYVTRFTLFSTVEEQRDVAALHPIPPATGTRSSQDPFSK